MAKLLLPLVLILMILDTLHTVYILLVSAYYSEVEITDKILGHQDMTS